MIASTAALETADTNVLEDAGTLFYGGVSITRMDDAQ